VRGTALVEGEREAGKQRGGLDESGAANPNRQRNAPSMNVGTAFSLVPVLARLLFTGAFPLAVAGCFVPE
jgi:hypothetical protein